MSGLTSPASWVIDWVRGIAGAGTDGKRVSSQDDYYSALEAHQPGDRINIKTRRADTSQSYTVELIESQ